MSNRINPLKQIYIHCVMLISFPGIYQAWPDEPARLSQPRVFQDEMFGNIQQVLARSDGLWGELHSVYSM